jgi:hypothetical protein
VAHRELKKILKKRKKGPKTGRNEQKGKTKPGRDSNLDLWEILCHDFLVPQRSRGHNWYNERSRGIDVVKARVRGITKKQIQRF